MATTGARRSLTAAQLDELKNHVEDRLRIDPCNGTLRHAKAFLAARGFDVRAVTRWLNRHGGYCDCEVLMNVGAEWRDPP